MIDPKTLQVKAKRLDNGEWVTGRYMDWWLSEFIGWADQQGHYVGYYDKQQKNGIVHKIDPTTICRCLFEKDDILVFDGDTFVQLDEFGMLEYCTVYYDEKTMTVMIQWNQDIDDYPNGGGLIYAESCGLSSDCTFFSNIHDKEPELEEKHFCKCGELATVVVGNDNHLCGKCVKDFDDWCKTKDDKEGNHE